MRTVLSHRAFRFLLFVIVVLFGALMLVPESTARTPLLLILLGVPLLFRLVPRNPIYGMRTCYASPERWYRQNVFTGMAMLIAGVVWMFLLASR
jgi:hypothetical protein